MARKRTAHSATSAAPASALDDFETLSVQIYRVLRGEIIMGQLSPGTRLVRRALSKRFGVSPIPVTEALFRLEQDGLVESEPMYGARVRPMTIETVRNDQALREAIECQTARMCAENATAGQIADLAAKAKGLDELVSRGIAHSRKGMDAHFDFHMAVAQYARCPVLAQTLERVWFRRLMQNGWTQAALYHLPRGWHGALVQALAARDPERAEAVMRQHVRFNSDKCFAALARPGKRQAARHPSS
jgi:DNA-binding GntR family transcriptional regulator